jgi:hypothetical protein
METLAPKRNKYAILMKYKSKAQKEAAINELIDLIISGRLLPTELEEAKEDAKTLAESLLRSKV